MLLAEEIAVAPKIAGQSTYLVSSSERTAIGLSSGVIAITTSSEKKVKKNNDRYRNSDKPKQNGHDQSSAGILVCRDFAMSR
jgi:hypothetical protein